MLQIVYYKPYFDYIFGIFSFSLRIYWNLLKTYYFFIVIYSNLQILIY